MKTSYSNNDYIQVMDATFNLNYEPVTSPKATKRQLTLERRRQKRNKARQDDKITRDGWVNFGRFVGFLAVIAILRALFMH